MSSFRFELATPADNAELLDFGRTADSPGMVRFSFDRAPDYLGAMRVEGQQSQVLVCREVQSGRIVATGHKSVKPMYVDGRATPVGYLGGLRMNSRARSGLLLARGYAALHEHHAGGTARFYLSTIMEDNPEAKAVLVSGRCGLPSYQDLGRFCCMALSLRASSLKRSGTEVSVRRATEADGPAVVAFLRSQGPARQFFPEYRVEDFGRPHGLLSHLAWDQVYLGWRGKSLVGVMAAWDQRLIRRWQVTGYSGWLSLLRSPLNLWASFRGMPLLPKAGSSLNYFVLSLVCIQDSDGAAFAALLDEVIHDHQDQYAFFLAGLHERDPLLPQLLARPHFPLFSRLYAVAWDDGAQALRDLDRSLVPYLELGSL